MMNITIHIVNMHSQHLGKMKTNRSSKEDADIGYGVLQQDINLYDHLHLQDKSSISLISSQDVL